MSVLAIAIFAICPILSLPFLLVGLKKDRKHKNMYLVIIAIFVALFSYIYRPRPGEDLYRHHIDVMQYNEVSGDALMKDISQKPEQISTLYKFLIGKTGNQDLLQFFTSAISFYILFYLLSEYTKKNKGVKGWRLIAIWVFVISGFHFIVITSGIFYTLALEIFSLGVYLDYEKNKKMWGWILYILPILIHTCTVFSFVVLVLYKILGSKINIKNILILFGLIISIGFLLIAVVPNINLPIFTELSNLYRWYFNDEEAWASLHTVPVLIMYLSRLVPVYVAHKMVRQKNKISDFSFFMLVAVIALYFQTTFSIRYIHIVILCGLPVLFEAAGDQKNGKLFSLSLYMFAVPHFIYQIHQFAELGYFENVERIFVTNLITMLSKGEV